MDNLKLLNRQSVLNREVSIRCPVHHIKFVRHEGCPECNRMLHERKFIPANVFLQDLTEFEK
jgi:hypothetical protein